MKKTEIKEVKELFEKLDALHSELYSIEPCGGMLHIVLDDFNLDDGSILFCHRQVQRNNILSETVATVLCKEILKHVMKMNHEERFIWFWCSSMIEDGISSNEIFQAFLDASYRERCFGGKEVKSVRLTLEDEDGTLQQKISIETYRDGIEEQSFYWERK